MRAVSARFFVGLTTGFATLALVLAAGTASAGNTAQSGSKGAKTAKVKTYDFSGDTIDGDLVKPEGSQVDARAFAKHGSLIRIRKDFIPEIIKSAEDL